MSIGGVTGLPFPKDYLNFQKAGSQPKGQAGIFSAKNDQGKVLAQKLQAVSQVYQQKGSIFQTEEHKTNIVEDGYKGKLSDQKWAQVNYEFEQNNLKLVNNTAQSLENAVISTNLKIKEQKSKIASTNSTIKDLDTKMAANATEIEKINQIFSTEEQSRAAKAHAESNYNSSLNKDGSLQKELDKIEGQKGKSIADVEDLKQKKADAGNVIAQSTSRKQFISQRKTAITNQKPILASEIKDLQGKISDLKAKRGASAPVVVGKKVIEAAPSTTVALEANPTADAKASNIISTEQSTETSRDVVSAELNQAQYNADIDAQILSLEAALNAKINEQNQSEQELASLENEDKKLDKEIKDKENEIISTEAQIENKSGEIPDLDNQINSKRAALENNKKVTKELEEKFKNASEVHSANLKNRQNVESRYNELIKQNKEMSEKKENSDKKLKDLNKVEDYFTCLLEGQGQANVGYKAEVEIAQQKETRQYETFLSKSAIVNNTKLGLFSQQDVKGKAKNDLTNVSLELEVYAKALNSTKTA